MPGGAAAPEGALGRGGNAAPGPAGEGVAGEARGGSSVSVERAAAGGPFSIRKRLKMT